MPRTRLLPLAVTLLLAGCSSGGGSSTPILVPRWSGQQRLPSSSHLRAVRFANAAQGIVAGEASTFVRTDNGDDPIGPLTWTQQEHAPFLSEGDVTAMSALGGHVWAIGTDSAGAGVFWFSPDGRQWRFFTPTLGNTAAPFVGVSAVLTHPAQAYLLRPDGEILKVSDGLETILNVGDAGPWNDIGFIPNSPLGWVVGDGGKIFETEDGGKNWSMLASQTTNDLLDFHLTSTFGYAGGVDGTVVNLLPNDPMMTPPFGVWADASGAAPVAGLTLRAVSFPEDVDTGWALGDFGGAPYIQHTIDGGTNWVQQPLPVGTPDLYDLWFVDNQIGYAVGDFGTFMRTLDGGTTWLNLTQGTLDQFNAVDFTSDGMKGLAVGNGGVIMRTLDGGATWTSSASGTADDLFGVSVPDGGSGDVAYVCGANGTLRKTVDFGATTPWTDQAPAVGGADLRAIHFATDDNIGICVGLGTTVIRTIDGGANWIAPTTAPPAADYYALSADVAGLDVYAGGTGSVVATSADSGDNWAAVTPADPATGADTVLALQSPPPLTHLFAGVNDGNVYGQVLTQAWTGVAPPGTTAQNVRGLSFTNPMEGWCVLDDPSVSDDGGIFYTTDTGATWNVSPDHTYWTLRAIWMSPTEAGLGYAVGDNGTILKTTVGGLQTP